MVWLRVDSRQRCVHWPGAWPHEPASVRSCAGEAAAVVECAQDGPQMCGALEGATAAAAVRAAEKADLEARRESIFSTGNDGTRHKRQTRENCVN